MAQKHKSSHNHTKKPSTPAHKKPLPPHVIVSKKVVKHAPVTTHMKVLTSNAVIMNHKTITPKDYMSAADGGMRGMVFIVEKASIVEPEHSTKSSSIPKMQTPCSSKEELVVLREPEISKKMKIFTDYPVIINRKKESPKDYYLNAAGSTTNATGDPLAVAAPTGVSKAGHLWNTVKGLWQKVQGSGAIQNFQQGGLQGAMSGGANQTASVSTAPPVVVPPGAGKKKGMSTGAKVGIVVGVLAIVGVSAYLIHKHNKAAK